MKARFVEQNTAHWIELIPESVEDTVRLVRIGMNWTTKGLGVYTDAHASGTLQTFIVIGKRGRPVANIPKIK